MKLLGKLYRENIYAIIATLAFHLAIFLFLLLAEARIKGTVKEEAILIDFTTEEIVEPEPVEPQEEVAERKADAASTNVASNESAVEATTNAPAKSRAYQDEFFDDEYLKELESAQNLVDEVSNQLTKKIIELDDIEMPEDVTEGMDPDSISNVIYKGESNIRYDLANRYHLRLPIPIYLAQSGGEVIIDIWVNRRGKVVNAEPRIHDAVSDEMLYAYAKKAAVNTVFNADRSAPAEQKGTITYLFIAQ